MPDIHKNFGTISRTDQVELCLISFSTENHAPAFRWALSIATVLFLLTAGLLPYQSLHAQTPSSTVVYADSFKTQTLDRYAVEGDVNWVEEGEYVSLEGNSESAIYTDTTFDNHITLSGEVYIPASNQNQYGSVALAVRDDQQGNLYWATLAYGEELEQEDHMSIMLNDQWGDTTGIPLEHGSWYHVKMATEHESDQSQLLMKAWPRGDDEPADWQVSRPLAAGFSAGGVGFRHYGNGSRADNLVVHQSEQVEQPWKDPLPKPILADHPRWVDLYWAAWQIASSKVQHGTEANGFVDSYLDEGFNDHIFQWDTAFMMFFANYANGFVPSIVSLDNFYRSQHSDGAIDREILESDGSDFHDKSEDDYTNPPLFGWAEWDYYQTTGDSSRFDRVLPVLVDYYEWIRHNRRSENNMYWYSNLGSGMDNSPRPEDQIAGWIDYTAQQAMEARYIAKIAEVLGRSDVVETFRQRSQHLHDLIDKHAWNASDGYYWDVGSDNQQIKTKTAASFWPMVAGLTDSSQAAKLVGHLQNPDEFYRPHLFPTLSADHSAYEDDGGYWKGGVWAPTNMMYIKGLQTAGYEEFATEAARNHIEMMSKVYHKLDRHTIWENYAPESADRGDPSRPGFVGWSGNGPITLLIENILGFRPNAPGDTLVWRPTLTERHGIRDLSWGDHKTDIVARKRASLQDSITADITAEAPFVLAVKYSGDTRSYQIESGSQTISVPGRKATALQEAPEQPSGVTLEANYPNPFNPVTTIPYTLKQAATVSLSIYDVTGRKIRTLVDQKQQTAGRYEVDFRAGQLGSGLYYYRLETSGRSWQRPMMLVK